jgi:DNA-binding PadR family transcriptional regulator
MSNRHRRKEPDIPETQRSLTDFEHVLLGYIARRPESGYGLKRRFASTPLGVYRPSPGALYPALRRLVSRGLLAVEDLAQGDRARGRGRAQRLYKVTEEGHSVFLAWLRQPVDPDTVAHDIGLHVMRFAMMEGELPPEEARAFLADFADALGRFVDGLEGYVASGAAPATPHTTLALQHGIAIHRASLVWAREALREIG